MTTPINKEIFTAAWALGAITGTVLEQGVYKLNRFARKNNSDFISEYGPFLVKVAASCFLIKSVLSGRVRVDSTLGAIGLAIGYLSPSSIGFVPTIASYAFMRYIA